MGVKSYFSEGAIDYSYDLGELGQFYNVYKRFMAHIHRVLPNAILDIQYENIVADQRAETIRLLDYIGLEWEDSCMEFFKTDRVVRTLSMEQVRRPIYSDSIGAWKRYEKQLAPLLNELEQPASI